MASKEEGEEASGGSDSREPSREGPSSSQGYDDDEGTVELVRRYLAEKLGFYKEDKEKEDVPKVLEDVSVDGIVKLIKEGKCKKIVTLAGAGISTSAGIPDFRSPGSGLYHNLQKYNLPNPQAIFEIGFFRENPQPFFTLAKELYPGSFKPTVCHYFIKLLHEKGVLLRHYTQNIDTLERVAGMPGDKIIEAHGTFYTSHCLDCKKEYSMEWMKEIIFQDSVPTCTSCNGVVKPDIVFFGENLPASFYSNCPKDLPNADLLIIMGSSLAVQPFASLVDKVRKTCPRLLINREKVGGPDRLMQMLGMGGGLDFDSPSNTRDVMLLGDCDQGCQLLADKLGWGDELREMVKTEHKKIDEEKNTPTKQSSAEEEQKGSDSEKSSLPTT
ncbi:NAD-dependent protein deacetylase sirtuin-2 [Macrosteles quadrilineatus]|uniref:NAD-dependent protein deacetylase sirtuin-2 n=1 Tax=Macrosteles quadrilineatus TaxID=74068 RepID=UPI0023E0FC3E|nr:NAD-dependent protein deacetylase sirtuin-2 [Macrosteles quadrilineatus]